MRWGLPTYAVAVIAFGLAPNWPLGLAALLVVGGGFLVVIATTNTAVQMIVADEMRGRVMSVRVMGFTLAFPVGSLAQGALGDWWGPQLTVVIFGCDPSLGRGVVVDQADAARSSRRSRRHPRPITTRGLFWLGGQEVAVAAVVAHASHIDVGETSQRQPLDRGLMTPRRAEPFAAVRQRHGHAMHGRHAVHER